MSRKPIENFLEERLDEHFLRDLIMSTESLESLKNHNITTSVHLMAMFFKHDCNKHKTETWLRDEIMIDGKQARDIVNALGNKTDHFKSHDASYDKFHAILDLDVTQTHLLIGEFLLMDCNHHKMQQWINSNLEIDDRNSRMLMQFLKDMALHVKTFDIKKAKSLLPSNQI